MIPLSSELKKRPQPKQVDYLKDRRVQREIDMQDQGLTKDEFESNNPQYNWKSVTQNTQMDH